MGGLDSGSQVGKEPPGNRGYLFALGSVCGRYIYIWSLCMGTTSIFGSRPANGCLAKLTMFGLNPSVTGWKQASC